MSDQLSTLSLLEQAYVDDELDVHLVEDHYAYAQCPRCNQSELVWLGEMLLGLAYCSSDECMDKDPAELLWRPPALLDFCGISCARPGCKCDDHIDLGECA